jgi:hypothetical protein
VPRPRHSQGGAADEFVPADDRRRRHGDHHCQLALGESCVQAAEENSEQVEKEGNGRHLCGHRLTTRLTPGAV